ncbi:hypothetical protein MRX96_026863 [Rhipicephalus microplus]
MPSLISVYLRRATRQSGRALEKEGSESARMRELRSAERAAPVATAAWQARSGRKAGGCEEAATGKGSGLAMKRAREARALPAGVRRLRKGERGRVRQRLQRVAARLRN